MIVRFAELCDNCGRRSEEYTCWPTCEECGESICQNCDIPEARFSNEGELTTVCRHCDQYYPNNYHAMDDRYEPQTLADVGMCEADFR